MLEGSRYLDLAEKIISARGIPLTGSQIIDFAEEYDVLPYEGYRTVVKTLQARISEDIAKQRNKSRFVRTGIGRYFLRRLAVGRSGYGSNGSTKDRGPRTKPDHPHRILTVSTASIPGDYVTSGWNSISQILENGRYDYQSEIQSGFMPVVTCVALAWNRQYFTFRVGVHTHFESISGHQTIFLRKFLDEFDLDLFETDGTGATASTARAALPVLAEGRRSRLEAGRLSKTETLQFYQVSSLLRNKMAMRSEWTKSLLLASTIDLSTAFKHAPSTQRRLELNNPAWIAEEKLQSTVEDTDAIQHIHNLENWVRFR